MALQRKPERGYTSVSKSEFQLVPHTSLIVSLLIDYKAMYIDNHRICRMILATFSLNNHLLYNGTKFSVCSAAKWPKLILILKKKKKKAKKKLKLFVNEKRMYLGSLNHWLCCETIAKREEWIIIWITNIHWELIHGLKPRSGKFPGETIIAKENISHALALATR